MRTAIKPKSLRFEALEDRCLLAADLEIVSVQLTNAFGEAIAHLPAIGEKVYALVHYRTSDLSPADAYRVRWEMDGVALEESFTGSVGTNVDRFWYHGGWIADAGIHTVTVTIDSGSEVAEANEANNVLAAAAFTSLAPDLPQKFAWPLPGAQSVDWVVEGYVDADPVAGFESVADFQGRGATYDGHNGIDIALPHFAAMDDGVPVLAAADGVVSFARDGDYDRWLSPPFPYPDGNIVVIDHGNGWQTAYYHLRRGSVEVAVGDAVAAGEPIGLVGSSGYSFRPHLHFEVTHHGTPVDAFEAPSEYFVSPLPYTFDAPKKLLDVGITNVPPTFEDVAEHVSDIDSFPQTASPIFFQAWAIFASLEAGDQWEVQLFTPNGALYSNFDPVVVASDAAWQWAYWFGDLPANPALGDWRADWIINGQLVAQNYYAVSAAAHPEMRVYEEDGLDLYGTLVDKIIIDARSTPLEFATADFGAPATTKTFTVQNHGYANLTIGAVVLPVGYAFVEPLSTTIAPGGSDTFTVQLLTNAVGPKLGEILILSNDSSEASFSIPVEGLVDGNDADFNNDGHVDGADFLTWQRHAGVAQNALKAQGDATGEGAVNSEDLAAWKSGFGLPPESLATSGSHVADTMFAGYLAADLFANDLPTQMGRGVIRVAPPPAATASPTPLSPLQAAPQRSGLFVADNRDPTAVAASDRLFATWGLEMLPARFVRLHQ